MERVVVTGMGAVTPIGNDIPSFWEGLKTGKNGIAPITHFDTTEYKAKLAAEVKDFDPTAYMDKRESKRMERYCHFAIAAAKQAAEQAGIKEGAFNPERAGVFFDGKRSQPSFSALYSGNDCKYGCSSYFYGAGISGRVLLSS